ncbi:MAG: FAD-dependent oxidoreductase [Ornithinimicrobium sp.]
MFIDTRPGTRPVLVIGAGPIGLAAAAELHLRGVEVTVLEAGHRAGSAVRSWGHVRLFSPWSQLMSPAAAELLRRTDWIEPSPDDYPTGHEWATRYLDPLAALMEPRVRYGHRVIGVAKRERDLTVDGGRADEPFVVTVQDSRTGSVDRHEARAVIDASGTTGQPNPLGAEGYPAAGEVALSGRLRYGTPDPITEKGRYAGRATVVVGAGTSALTSLIALTSIAAEHPDRRVVWALRRSEAGVRLGGHDADELPRRGALGAAVAKLVRDRAIEVVTSFRTVSVEPDGDRLRLVSADGAAVRGLDEVVVATGYRPDLSFLSEVRLDLDSRLQAPRALAPSIDPNQHSCGSVAPHGFEVLQQGEPGLFLAGMKSYGRAASFLAMVGFEQVRSIAAAIDGDLAAAQAVALRLPDTGVCGGAGLFDPAPA